MENIQQENRNTVVAFDLETSGSMTGVYITTADTASGFTINPSEKNYDVYDLNNLEKGKVYYVEQDNIKFIFQFSGDILTVEDKKMPNASYLIGDPSMHADWPGQFAVNVGITVNSSIREASLYEKKWLEVSIENNSFVERNDVPLSFSKESVDEFFNGSVNLSNKNSIVTEEKKFKTIKDLTPGSFYRATNSDSSVMVFKFKYEMKDSDEMKAYVEVGMLNVKQQGWNIVGDVFIDMNTYSIDTATSFEEHWLDESSEDGVVNKVDAISNFSFQKIEDFIEQKDFLMSDVDKYVTLYDERDNYNYDDLMNMNIEHLSFVEFSKQYNELPLFKIRPGRTMEQYNTLFTEMLKIGPIQLMDENGLREYHHI